MLNFKKCTMLRGLGLLTTVREKSALEHVCTWDRMVAHRQPT